MGDGNGAAASVAYRMSELAAIYPITPSSPMAELYDGWSVAGRENIWGTVPEVVAMQSEAGVAGAIHGALHCGSIVTTFTASQGLLLMVPVLYKIAGELLPFCLHVTSRAIATHALSIFGDHSDVMACRGTGCAMLASASVQEAHDMAAIATAATFETRLPFLHFFDGFRTSHEINGYHSLDDGQLRQLLDPLAVEAFRLRAMDPDHPTIRGTAQNSDVFFQGRERINPFHAAAPSIVGAVMERFLKISGRAYAPFDYFGDAAADAVFVCMGSACETIEETIRSADGGRLGLVKVRLYRPFSPKHLVKILPTTVRHLIVLDRTKEPGSVGEPLYLDVATAVEEARNLGLVAPDFHPTVLGGRYGLGSKEFSPPMVRGIVDALRQGSLQQHFTVGIDDDLTRLSVPYDGNFCLPQVAEQFEAIFYGLGSDGTVGANKNSIKIIGEEAGLFAQAYFVYDSKKSGSTTISHLRFGPRPIRAPYLIQRARFIGCHQFSFLTKSDLIAAAEPGAVLLVNAPFEPHAVQDNLPKAVQEAIFSKNLQLFAIDAYRVARECGMDRHINTIMQTCFFAISGVLPRDRAIAAIKRAIEKTYGGKGRTTVEKNFACVDAAIAQLFAVQLDPRRVPADGVAEDCEDLDLPPFVARVTVPLLRGRGESLPVSAFPADGTWPTATSCHERRGIAREIPIWNPTHCIQCAKCALICPHAAIRVKHYPESSLADAPNGFLSAKFKSNANPGHRYTVQVAPDDCTGCGLCGEICPMKAAAIPPLTFQDAMAVRAGERKNFSFFQSLPQPPPCAGPCDGKTSQFRRPLFEFSGACAGCGETAYIKLLTQLFGDHLIIANATGCSSIYGGNLPTTPYCVDADGRGPAWANSLFEDNAEFGLGMVLALRRRRERAEELLQRLAAAVGGELPREILSADQSSPLGIALQRKRVAELKKLLVLRGGDELQELRTVADDLVHRTVWTIGGDGWAYDIGFGGLDHVLAGNEKMRILVLDTEVYSNTGGQQSKATPLGAVAKFAAAGKGTAKKDLGRMVMAYGHVYVAQVALGARDGQTVAALQEAESFPGPAIVIAYCPCIAHGYDLRQQLQHQKAAVATGHWPLYRYDPRRESAPLQLDSRPPMANLETFFATESRFSWLAEFSPERARTLGEAAQRAVARRMDALGSGPERNQ